MTPGQKRYEDYVRRYYELHPPAPSDRLSPPWDQVDPESQAKWEALAADFDNPQPVQQSLF